MPFSQPPSSPAFSAFVLSPATHSPAFCATIGTMQTIGQRPAAPTGF